MLGITNHAVEQFCSRWRPDTPAQEAERELRALVAVARPTRRRTPSRDARMYVTTTEAGEEIGLVVRDAQVITVLADRGEGRELVDHSADIELYEESKADLAAARAQLAQEPPNVTPLEQERRANAIRTINDWHRGIRITTKAVERAHNCLGINIGDPLPGEPPPPPPPPPVDVVEESRRKNAEHLIAKWKAGANYSNKVVKKAHAVLGIPFNPNETR